MTARLFVEHDEMSNADVKKTLEALGYDATLPAPLRWLWRVMIPHIEGSVYQSPWMRRHHLPPVPLWTVGWLFDLVDWARGRRR
jgi:hypothetical protein